MGIKGSVKNAAAMAYQVVYNSTRQKDLTRPNRRPVVLFTSTSRAELGGNMLCIYNRMVERGMNEEYDIRFDLRASIKDAQSMKKQMTFVQGLACADIIFCDDYHPFLYFVNYPADVKVVQLWHAVGAFKTVGFARKRENAEEFARNSRAHRSYTHVIVSAKCDRKHYAKAFGLPEERIYPTGIPRIDQIVDKTWQENARKAFFEAYPQAVGKRVMLFAPTFRGEDVRHGSYDFGKLDSDQLAVWCRKTNSVLMLKFHPFTQSVPPVPAELRDVIINASDIREVNDILPAADLLVTDYSSVIFEASLLDIPMVFYAYDLQEYERTRGFFEPYYSFVPGPVAKDFPKLMDLLREGGDPLKVKDFRKKHFAHVDSGSTDRVIDLVFEK